MLAAARDHALEAHLGAPPPQASPVLLAGGGELVQVNRAVLLEHGVGQTYNGISHASWAGGEGRDNVVLFICPNERVARANAARYPTTPCAVVGSPHLEQLRDRTPYRLVEQRIAISCHWESALCPETRSGFAHFEAAYEKACRQSPGSFVLHGHPRHQEYTAWKAREWGVEFEPDFAKVTDRAWCYVTDNSSTLYEWAALDRPVVVVSPPWYRRTVEHGLRFWEFADVGVEVYDPAELDDAILFALADLRPQRLRRGEISRYLFGDDLSYGAASRAAAAIVEVL